MSTEKLFIPDKIKVGFQNRSDTYTKKLAYVVYFDEKGILRKERSWQSWRDGKIDPQDFNNEPTEGFVLNRNGGGNRYSYGWNARNEFIRVWDPRDFEFEISLANLLFILKECDCSRGKGLEGQFVYAWDGTELVLLPVNSEDYKKSKVFTQYKSESIKSKDLILGATYTTKQMEDVVYLGRFEYHVDDYIVSYRKPLQKIKKEYIFWSAKNKNFDILELKTLAVISSELPVSNYAELVEQYYKSKHGSKPIDIKIIEGQKSSSFSSWYEKLENDVYLHYTANYKVDGSIYEIIQHQKIWIENNILKKESVYKTIYRFNEYGRNSSYFGDRYTPLYKEPIPVYNNGLMIVLESGTTYLI